MGSGEVRCGEVWSGEVRWQVFVMHATAVLAAEQENTNKQIRL